MYQITQDLKEFVFYSRNIGKHWTHWRACSGLHIYVVKTNTGSVWVGGGRARSCGQKLMLKMSGHEILSVGWREWKVETYSASGNSKCLRNLQVLEVRRKEREVKDSCSVLLEALSGWGGVLTDLERSRRHSWGGGNWGLVWGLQVRNADFYPSGEAGLQLGHTSLGWGGQGWSSTFHHLYT